MMTTWTSAIKTMNLLLLKQQNIKTCQLRLLVNLLFTRESFSHASASSYQKVPPQLYCTISQNQYCLKWQKSSAKMEDHGQYTQHNTEKRYWLTIPRRQYLLFVRKEVLRQSKVKYDIEKAMSNEKLALCAGVSECFTVTDLRVGQ